MIEINHFSFIIINFKEYHWEVYIFFFFFFFLIETINKIVKIFIILHWL